MGTVIIKYNAGNIFSVKCALNRIGVDATVSDNLDVISSADRVISRESVKRRLQCDICIHTGLTLSLRR